MYCEHLSLTNFRNYVRLEFDLPPGVTLLIGANAQGKTNLLEALYYLATTRSFRAATDRELVNWAIADDEFQFSRLACRVRRLRDQVGVEIVMRPARFDRPGEPSVGRGYRTAERANGAEPTAAGPSLKRIKVNGVPKRAIDLIGQITVVAFAPGDVDLVCGPPALRRRYLDITISQIDHRYVRTLSLYQKVLLQRNSLLRAIREGRARPDQLGYWNEELAAAGAYIVHRRAEALAALQRLAQPIHRDLTGLREQFELSYAPNLALDNHSSPRPLALPPLGLLREKRRGDQMRVDLSAADDEAAALAALRECFMAELKVALPREAQLGQSLVGPHRDDILFHIDGVNMNAYGSRGQQRTVALSLKLGELQLMRESTGQLPILLLDDVMSELDAERRARVLGAIVEGQQVLATATELDQFDPAFRREANAFQVRGGTLSRYEHPGD